MVLSETVVNEEFIQSMQVHRQKPDKALIEACSENIVLFSEHMLGLKLYAWQIFFLMKLQLALYNNELTREYVGLTSRQIGKSTAVAVFSLWCSIFNKYPGTVHNNTVIGIISASDVQAKKLLYEIKKFIRSGDKYMAVTYLDNESKPVFGEKFFSKLLDDAEPNNMTTITFKAYKEKTHGPFILKGSFSGSMIKSYPPTSAVLGETFTVVIEDEAGKTDKIDDQFHYDYIYPTGNSTNAIRVYTSTPWTPSGFFYRLADPMDEFVEHPADRVMFTIEAIKLENPAYYKTVMKTINQMNLDGKTDEVQRAYYCRFVKGESSFFDTDAIANMFSPEYQEASRYPNPCDMGIDFGGQVTSKTVITISTLNEDHTIVRLYSHSYDVGKDLNLLEDIQELLTRFNVDRIIPDDCAAGFHLIEKMKLKGWNVQPRNASTGRAGMNFSSDKVKKYSAFRAALKRGEVKSYIDDNLKTEMLALEYNQGLKQSMIMHAPGYTDDLIDSFLMSTYFYIQEDEGFNYYDMNDYNDDGEIDDTVHDSKKVFKNSF